jgi:hypothetical protein
MATSDAPATRTGTGRRRTVLIVSLVAIVILGVIGTSLVLLTGDSDGSDGSGEQIDVTGPHADATAFDDPQGAYTVDIDPRWTANENATNPEVESWFTGTGNPAFRDNVNIVTQQIGQMDLDQYMQLVTGQAAKTVPDYKLREFRIVSVDDASSSDTTAKVPPQLGVFAYTGKNQGKDFGFLFIASVEHGRAVLATLTTGADRFEKLRDRVEPYLMTLRQTA